MKVIRAYLCLTAIVLLSFQPARVDEDRIPTYGKNGMVTSASMIASEVGLDILKSGGNAIDATVATALAMAVTWPAAGNIGGGGFIVYLDKDGHSTTFDFREKAPLASTERMYLGDDGKVQDNSNHDGLLAVGVPGTVAGLYKAHQKFGSKPWAELVEPAVKLAADGFPMSWAIYRAFNWYQNSYFKEYPSSARAFLKADGSVYEPGEIWKQPDLAATLARIRDQGHDGFYKGETARKLAQFMAENGGLITERDMGLYEAIEREPVRGTYRGYDIISMPPPSSGGTVLVEMLNILEGYNLEKIGHNSALYLHLLTEAMRRAYADRARYLGDPDFNPDLPIDMLTSKSYADELRPTIDLFRASESDSAHFNSAYESENTTHFSVIDKEGNAVSLTYTLEHGYGTKIVAEGLGFLLNNEMGDFNAVPGLTDTRGRIGTNANLIRPQKRMLSSMTPTIVARDGRPYLLIGSPGGRTIINTVLQVILNMVDHGMNVGQAVEAGRIHHQWLPDVIRAERWEISPDTWKLLENMGHQLSARGSQGTAMGIHYDVETGLISGIADSRSPDGGVAAY